MLIKLVQLFCELCNPESSVCIVFCMTRSSVSFNLHLDVSAAAAAGYQTLATKTRNINWRLSLYIDYLYISILQMFMGLVTQHILRRLSINRISFARVCFVSLSLSAPYLTVISSPDLMGRTTFVSHIDFISTIADVTVWLLQFCTFLSALKQFKAP